MPRLLAIGASLVAAALLGLWVGVMWGSVDRIHHESEPHVSGPPAVTTER